MGKGLLSVGISLILLSMSLSGCLSEADKSSDSGTEPVPEEEEPFFEDGDYRCFEHDERCWLTHVPESVNGSEPVPCFWTCMDGAFPRTGRRNLRGSMP